MTFSSTVLESHLWESANILRGPVDAADFKTYIFPLLFFKRICDVWDEEYKEIVDETGDEQLAHFPESHRFQIPKDCHWNDIRTKASNVGTALPTTRRAGLAACCWQPYSTSKRCTATSKDFGASCTGKRKISPLHPSRG